ncbi:MAG: response regulator transcription factor [Gammaproteobacteria bacterium]|nr:response regulator transcription factor [Gammaproteobacteria bacterium]MDH5651124.1 response regulator transcription factor [Gammaproteobacteria bacterium]
MTNRILVVEDNQDMADLVAMHLRDMGCEVSVVHDGDAGLAAARQASFDLLILDLMLPGTDGLQICKQLRQDADYTPVLMLTAKSTELDRVLGLEIGADDYLTKPFSIRELLARVKAILRRIETYNQVETTQAQPVIRVGELCIDNQRRTVELADKVISLTAKEFDLLWHFASQPGRVFTRMQLLDSIWGYCHEGYEHTVNSHINRLRAKIEQDPSKPVYILTVWGVGYKFTEQDKQLSA